MAETKEKEKTEEASTTFLNRGLRIYDLGTGSDGKPRRHLPGTTMAYTEDEAKQHEGYSDLVDVTKMPGTESARKVKADRDRLANENEALKAQLAALSAPADAAPAEAAPAAEASQESAPKAKKGK